MLPHEDEEVGRVHSQVDLQHNRQQKERRERIATAVLSGLMGNALRQENANEYEHIARRAIRQADALIAELDK